MDLGGGGSASFQFPNGLGTTGRATILDFRTEQQTEYSDGPQGSGIKKGDLKFFPDGKPMPKIVIDLQTQYRNGEGLKAPVAPGTDDGRRTIHLQGHKAPDTTSSLQAVTKAALAAGCVGSRGKGAIRIGDDLELIGVGEVKTSSGQLAKKHEANYWMNTPSMDLAPAPAAVHVPQPPSPYAEQAAAMVAAGWPNTPAPAAVPAPPAPVVPTPAPAASPPPPPSPVAATVAPAGAPATVADPLLANLTPAQLAVLGQQAAPAVPPPPAVPAPPVAVPPPPAVTPEGFTLEQLVAGGWTREAALAQYPMLG